MGKNKDMDLLTEIGRVPCVYKAEITSQLVILNNRIARDSAQVPKLTTIISEVNEPYSDPASDKEPVLLEREEVRKKRVEGTIQLLAQTECTLREYQAEYKHLEAELKQLEQSQD